MKLKHQSNVSKHQSMPLQQDFFDAIHVVMPQQSIPLWLMRCAKRSARKGYHRSKRMAAWGLWMNRICTDARGWGIFRAWMQWNIRIHLKSSIFMLLSFLLAKGWFVNLWQYGDPIWASLLPVQCADAEVAAYCTDSYGRISLQEALPFQKILPLAANEEVNRDDSVSSNQG